MCALHCSKVFCNTYYLAEQVETAARRLGVKPKREPVLLGTGGCIENIRAELAETDYFLVHNGDIIHDYDLNDFVHKAIKGGALGTLLGAPHSGAKTLCTDKGGRLEGVLGYQGYSPSSHTTKRMTFSGIALYHRRFLDYLGKPGPEDIKASWCRALSDGQFIQVDTPRGHWMDFGTPQGLADTAFYLMEKTGEFSYNYANSAKRPYVTVEVEKLELSEEMNKVIVLEKPDNAIPHNLTFAIIGKDFRWSVQMAGTK